MLRLAHRILQTSNHRLFPWCSDDFTARRCEVIKRLLHCAQVVIADNVNEYYTSLPEDKMRRTNDLCGQMRLPHSSMFLEFAHAYGFDGQQECVDESMRIKSIGVLAHEMSQDEFMAYIHPDSCLCQIDTSRFERAIAFYPVVSCAMTTQFSPGSLISLITRDGSLYRTVRHTDGENCLTAEEYCNSFWCGAENHATKVAIFAITFMNCKNVARRDVTETEGPSAKWIRRQKAPTIRYHVLDINPMKEVLRTEGGIETNGIKKALHICRGHFATYTEEKPLFGKKAGTFWVPAHTRGDIKHGAVIKDYRVNAPAK